MLDETAVLIGINTIIIITYMWISFRILFKKIDKLKEELKKEMEELK